MNMKQKKFIKYYQAYSGTDFFKDLRFFLICMIGLSLYNILSLSTSGLFNETKLGFLSGVLAVPCIFFPFMNGYRRLELSKTNCYFLTIKNRFKAYRTWYFSYYSLLFGFSLILFCIIYLLGFLMKCLPQNAGLQFGFDISMIFFCYSIMPFFCIFKNRGLMMIKNFLIITGYIILSLQIKNSSLLYGMIIQFLLAPPLCYFSNRLWLKTMKASYNNQTGVEK